MRRILAQSPPGVVCSPGAAELFKSYVQESRTELTSNFRVQFNLLFIVVKLIVKSSTIIKSACVTEFNVVYQNVRYKAPVFIKDPLL